MSSFRRCATLVSLAHPRLAFVFAIAALGTLVGLAGCSDESTDPPPPEPSPYLPQTSPANVLANLRESFELRDAEGFLDQLYAPEFRFVRDALDLEDQPGLPRHWGYDCEAEIIEAMLGATTVLDVRLTFVMGTPQGPLPEDEAPDPDWQRILVTSVELEVEAVNPQDPTDNLIYRVPGDRAVFLFASDPNEIVEGAPAWKIAEWQDVRVWGGGRSSGAGELGEPGGSGESVGSGTPDAPDGSGGPGGDRGERPTGPASPARRTLENTFGQVKHRFRSTDACAELQSTNPRFVLENLADAYEGRDLEALAALFGGSSYSFTFDPVDAADPEIPDTWVWADELAAHTALFSRATSRLELSFRRGLVTAVGGGAASIAVEDVALEVRLAADPSQELVVTEATGVFTCAPDPTETAFGVPLWRILAWSDVQGEPRPSLTWGAVKARMR